MPLEQYINAGGRKLRLGYTTGSCAAMAAKAATRMLLCGEEVTDIELMTPKGILVHAPVLDAKNEDGQASCAVEKDAGDDIDATRGMKIYASVRKIAKNGIWIEGGVGIGRVTKRGLNQPVGSAAINDGPRKMIVKEVQDVCQKYSYDGGVVVTISAPEGTKIAEKTFNPRLGIVGGISILGSTGIVEPKSEKALVESIRLEIRVRAKEGKRGILFTPGNYGEEFIKTYPPLSDVKPVQCSNYIGEAIDMAREEGFSYILLAGHIGKLVKLAGGIMNTHSRWADCRLELLALYGMLSGGPREMAEKILDAATTEDGLDLLEMYGKTKETIALVMEKIDYYLESRAGCDIGALIFRQNQELIGKTKKADSLARRIGGEK